MTSDRSVIAKRDALSMGARFVRLIHDWWRTHDIDKRPADSRVEARYFDTADEARAWLSQVR